MSYADITFSDRNPIKRWLQRSRLDTALALGLPMPDRLWTVCDFGAGNGALCELLIQQSSNVQVSCFEPSPGLMAEAKELLGDRPGLRYVLNSSDIDESSLDVLFCLEVFEHLPIDEMQIALLEIQRIIKSDGKAVIGVPVEVGIPAAYKGLFRMTRRHGSFDATLKNVLKAIAGFPPKERPIAEISPGLRFHFEHMGFDFREFAQILSKYFSVERRTYSPIPLMGFLMPEVYFVVSKR